MADFVNPNDCTLVLSANDMPSPWQICTRAQAEQWQVIASRYRKWVVDHVEEMTAPEKSVRDQEIRDANRDSASAQLAQAEDVLRAFMLVVLDEMNAHALKMNAILDAIDASTNYSTLKANIALVADYPQRTDAQLRSAVRAKLGS